MRAGVPGTGLETKIDYGEGVAGMTGQAIKRSATANRGRWRHSVTEKAVLHHNTLRLSISPREDQHNLSAGLNQSLDLDARGVVVGVTAPVDNDRTLLDRVETLLEEIQEDLEGE